MEMISHNLLMYDEYCPLCRWYSQLFVDLKLLKPEERKSYQSCTKFQDQLPVDFDIARNQIAFYHKDQHMAYYGVDSILQVLAPKWPLVTKLFGWLPLYWLSKKAYNFISYNRKILAPSMMCTGDSCTPDKSWTYRLLFILISWVMVVSIVGRYFMMAFPNMMRWQISHIDAYIFTAQFLFQGLVLTVLQRKDFYQYFGHLAYVSLIGSILLWMLYGCTHLLNDMGIDLQPFAGVGFGVVLGIMLMMHKKRMEDHALPILLTWSWLFFRIMAALIVFKV